MYLSTNLGLYMQQISWKQWTSWILKMVGESTFGRRLKRLTKYCFKKRNFWNSLKFEYQKLIISSSLGIAKDYLKE
jgi:hypothetical protein